MENDTDNPTNMYCCVSAFSSAVTGFDSCDSSIDINKIRESYGILNIEIIAENIIKYINNLNNPKGLDCLFNTNQSEIEKIQLIINLIILYEIFIKKLEILARYNSDLYCIFEQRSISVSYRRGKNHYHNSFFNRLSYNLNKENKVQFMVPVNYESEYQLSINIELKHEYVDLFILIGDYFASRYGIYYI